MAKLTKKLHYRRSATEYTIDLHDATANVGSNYITLKVDGSPAYAQLAAVGTPGNSHLRVRKSGNVYAINSTVQDSNMISSGGAVGDYGSKYVPPVGLTSGTYYGTDVGRCLFSATANWAAISAMVCVFYVTINPHISGVGVDHYRLRYGTTTDCTIDGGVFSGTSRSTPEVAVGTYYFRVDAENASNAVLYSSAVYGGVASTYNMGNSSGCIIGGFLTSGIYNQHNCTVYFTADTDWAVPAGVTSVTISGIGGGGGGSGASLCYRPTAGGGGGSGYFVLDQAVAVTPGQVLQVRIGAGGGPGYSDWGGAQPDREGGRGAPGGMSYVAGIIGFSGGHGSNRGSVDDSGSLAGSQSGQSHSCPGRGAAGGVWGETGEGGNPDNGTPYFNRYYNYGGVGNWTAHGGRGGQTLFGYYGHGGDGGEGWWHSDNYSHPIGLAADATAGGPGLVAINYWQSSSWNLAINATTTTWEPGIVGTRRYFYPVTYTNQGWGTKMKDPAPASWSHFCADTCTCNCNYCACNCNYCSCNCNYCACNCNYSPCGCSSSP